MTLRKKCNYNNIFGTKYCQRCGSFLKESSTIFQWKNTGLLSGTGHKGSSLAPLGAMAISNQSHDLGPVTETKNLVKVQPLDSGHWYCPECGEYNLPHTYLCKGCGRDYV